MLWRRVGCRIVGLGLGWAPVCGGMLVGRSKWIRVGRQWRE